METRDQDTVEPAPPSWVLRTPTRHREVWTRPVLALVLAVVLVVVGVLGGDGLTSVVGTVSGVLVGIGAVALAVAGRNAFVEQTRAASWRFHVVGVVVGFGTMTLVALASLIGGIGVGLAAGVLAAGSQVFRNARSVPRSDRLVAAVSASVLAVGAVVVDVFGLVLPTVAAGRAGLWVGGGGVVAAAAIVIAVLQFRAASHAPAD